MAVNPNVTFIDVTDFLDLGSYAIPPVGAIPTVPAFQTTVNPLISKIDPNRVLSTVKALSGFPTRYYTSVDGEMAVIFLEEEYTKLAGTRNDITVSRFKNTWKQDSIIVRIEGDGSSDEVVIIGGHVDSVSSSAAAPGADDDASGSSVVLEIFRTLATNGFKPKRAIEFHGYSAEEAGLLGSQAIAKSYSSKGIKVAAMMQLDMTGYVKSGTVETIGIVTDNTDVQLNAFVRQLVDTYTKIKWTNTVCGYGCSDHASWTKAGYRSAFPFETIFTDHSPYIHTPNDLPQYVSLSHMEQFAKLGLSFLVELSLAK